MEIRHENNDITASKEHLKEHFCLFSKDKVHFRNKFRGII